MDYLYLELYLTDPETPIEEEQDEEWEFKVKDVNC
jgi:hypothetical protein